MLTSRKISTKSRNSILHNYFPNSMAISRYSLKTIVPSIEENLLLISKNKFLFDKIQSEASIFF